MLTGKRSVGTGEVIHLPTRPQSARDASNVPQDGRQTATVAEVLERWIVSGPMAAIVLMAIGALLGLLSRKYLPTQSIFQLW